MPSQNKLTTTNEMVLVKIVDGQAKEQTDTVAAEIAFSLIVNDKPLVSLVCSPSELDAMALGFLISEGLLSGYQSLLSIKVDTENFSIAVKIKDLPDDWENIFTKKTITSGCGHGVTFSDANSLHGWTLDNKNHSVTPKNIQQLIGDFRNASTLFAETGGVHSAALADKDAIVLFAEDIGRHNAVDKLIGKAFLNNISLHDKILLSSGRVSGEIMTKIIRSKIPILLSRSAPTCMSIHYAEMHGVTLIGFARGRRMNVYTHPLRINFDGIHYNG